MLTLEILGTFNGDMPRQRKPYVQKQVSRHGKVVWYFRRGKGPRSRLPGQFESPEWLEAYEAALANRPVEAPKSDPRTLKWLAERYFESAPFKALKPSSQRQRANVLKRVLATGGAMPFSLITRKEVAAGRDNRADTPFAAINYLKAMQALFAWAVDAGHINESPAAGVKRPAVKTNGHEPWTEADVIKFLDHHTIGTMAHLAMTLILFTGLARTDAHKIGPQHVKDGVIEWSREKTGNPLFIPVLPPLAQAIEACQSHQFAFLVTSHGYPFRSAAAFGNWFAERCREAGVTKRAHGLRKLSATIAAEGAGTSNELKAFYGWKTDAMAGYYTRSANQRVLAIKAGDKLASGSLAKIYGEG